MKLLKICMMGVCLLLGGCLGGSSMVYRIDSGNTGNHKIGIYHDDGGTNVYGTVGSSISFTQ